MRLSTLSRWVAVLALAMALTPGSVSATTEDGTITLTGTLHMDDFEGAAGTALGGVYASDAEHTWMLTLRGTTYSHSAFGTQRMTNVYATSLDLQFFGPAAEALNDVVGDPLAGGYLHALQLRNAYSDTSDDFSTLLLGVSVGGISLWAEDATAGSYALFPSDADGYPIVEPEPSSVWVEMTVVTDYRSGNYGRLTSWEDTVTLAGDLGSPIPATMRIEDGAAFEVDRGTSKLTLRVRLANTSDREITVDYRTVDGTAVAKSDYSPASGTLTFPPGETNRTITISIRSDRIREPDETFTVELLDPVGTTLDDAVATATIRNDD